MCVLDSLSVSFWIFSRKQNSPFHALLELTGRRQMDVRDTKTKPLNKQTHVMVNATNKIKSEKIIVDSHLCWDHINAIEEPSLKTPK